MKINRVCEGGSNGVLEMSMGGIFSLRALGRKAQRFLVLWREVGVIGASQRGLSALMRNAGFASGYGQRWIRHKASIDQEFDSAFHTVTGGIEDISRFSIAGGNAAHGHSHIASDPNELSAVLSQLQIPFSDFVFIDLGAGRGRAAIVAAGFSFRKIIGVEFAEELVEAARRNLLNVPERSIANRVEFVWEDAAEYQYPGEPLIVYLFNPFGWQIIKKVSEQLLESYRATPRPIVVIYMNPIYLDAFAQSGWRVVQRIEGSAILEPSPQD